MRLHVGHDVGHGTEDRVGRPEPPTNPVALIAREFAAALEPHPDDRDGRGRPGGPASSLELRRRLSVAAGLALESHVRGEQFVIILKSVWYSSRESPDGHAPHEGGLEVTRVSNRRGRHSAHETHETHETHGAHGAHETLAIDSYYDRRAERAD